MAPSKKAAAKHVLPEISEEESARLDGVCKKLLAKAGNDPTKATILGIEKAHYSIVFLARMIGLGADGKAVAVHFSNSPPILEMLSRAGVDLRFDDGALLTIAVEAGDWKAADYLVTFAGLPAARPALLRKAIEAKDRDLLNVLVAAIPPQQAADAWTQEAAEDLIKGDGCWQLLTDIWRHSKAQFRAIHTHVDVVRLASKAGANYLAFCSVKVLASEDVFPDISEEEAKPSKGLIPFIVRQLASQHAASAKLALAEEEEELNTAPLKPSALGAVQKSVF